MGRYHTSATTPQAVPFWLALLGALTLLAGCVTESTGPDGGGKNGAIDINNDRARLTGFIAEKSEGQIVVLSYVVLIVESTEIKGEQENQLLPTDLLVGMWVRVEGRIDRENVIVADEIEVDSRDDSLAPPAA
jgi:hypothetical protein